MTRRLVILYGSQTGTAQDLAELIWRNSKQYHFHGRVQCMDSYDVRDLIQESLVVFVCSTTGQGDEPDNMKSFWKFLLRKSLPSDSLRGMKFAVLGLGDSSYAKFNFVAKRLNKRLQQLGAEEIIPIGLCDDQHDMGPSAVYLNWIRDLWERLLNFFPLPSGMQMLESSPRQYRWNIEVIQRGNDELQIDPDNIYIDSKDFVFSDPFYAEIISNHRITSADHFQDVRLISLNPNDRSWNPGDVLMVRPWNSDDDVKALFNLFDDHELSIRPDNWVQVQEIDSEMPVPQPLMNPLTLYRIAQQYWDLRAIPRPRTFEILALNCKNELEKEKLMEFSSPSGQDDLFSYANRPRRTILEVLSDFPHATSQLTIPVLFELFNTIKPRSFSIASCMESNKLDLLVAVVQYKTILKAPRLGLCSNWLKGLLPKQRIIATVKKGTFSFPNNPLIPLIMVGPGTGLAPFRSFLQHNELVEKRSSKIVIFFGCRNKSKDYHCNEDLERMVSIKHIQLFVAFSRDQDEKVYVQHLIEKQKELLNELISNGGYIYVAGSSKNMPKSVKEAFENVAGYQTISEMIKNRRYQEETWA